MWLVLGSGGQLGRSMKSVLHERSIDAAFLGSSDCDITDADQVNNVMSSHRPSVVVNCAAWTAVDAAEDHEQEAFSVNCDGARNVAIACRSTGTTLVHISTDYVFRGTDPGEYPEDGATSPVSAYGRSKLCGETAVRAEHPARSYVVRTAWLYSEYGGNFVKTMLKRALVDQPVRVVNDQHGQPTLARDLAAHVVDLVSAGAPVGTYHGTNSGAATWFDFSREIFRLATGRDDLVSPVGTAEYPTRAVRPANSVLSHAKTRKCGVPEMRNWRLALAESLPAIIASFKEETK